MTLPGESLMRQGEPQLQKVCPASWGTLGLGPETP